MRLKIMAWHPRAALLGFLCTLPFFIANFIVSLRIEPFYALLESFPVIRSSSIFPLVLLLFFPLGAVVSIHPMLFKGKNSNRNIYILNSILAALLLAIFFFIFIPLAKDIYTCDILKIPNCD